MITGELVFQEKNYHFIIEDDLLKLDPVGTQKPNIFDALMNYNKFQKIESDYLIGKCYPDGHTIIIIVKPFYRFNNNTLQFEVEYIFEFKSKEKKISRVDFEIEELNYIFNIQKCIIPSQNNEGELNGIILKTHEETTTEKYKFFYLNKEISFRFGIHRSLTYGTSKTPINIHSVLMIEFEETDNYEFIISLYHIIISFIEFLCYRKNIKINEITLFEPNNDIYSPIGKFKDLNNNSEYIEKERIIKKNYITYETFNNNIGKLLQDLADNKIYLRHIPLSNSDGSIITEARFILITAAFEWEFKRKYPNGIKHNEKTINAREQVKEQFKEHIKNNIGRIKDIYKSLEKWIEFDRFAEKFCQAYKDLHNMIDDYAKKLYKRNNEEFDYKKSGRRLSEQRNNYAHGNLDKEFIGESVLDLIVLERLIYSIQLSHYNLNEENIMNALDQLLGKFNISI